MKKIICDMCHKEINETNCQPKHIINIKINNIEYDLCKNCFNPNIPLHSMTFNTTPCQVNKLHVHT